MGKREPRNAASALTDKTAVVTGASRGIGRAIAMELCRRRARVAFVARTRVALNAAAAEAGPKALPLPADLSDDASIARLLAEVEKRFGRLDLLVHSAGAIAYGDLSEASLSDLDRLYRINIRAPYALTQAALPLLKASHGQIAFVNSSITRAANIGGRGQFAATQHALKALADSVRDEVNRDDVRVVSIFPGSTATPRQEAIHSRSGAVYAPERLLQPADVATVLCDALSLPRTAEATDVYVRPMLSPCR